MYKHGPLYPTIARVLSNKRSRRSSHKIAALDDQDFGNVFAACMNLLDNIDAAASQLDYV